MNGVALPRDHGPHGDCAMEWWYATGCLEGPSGATYSYFATIWSTGFGLGRLHLAELPAGRTALSQIEVGALVRGDGPDPLDLTVGTHALRWRSSGRFGCFTFSATLPGGLLQLDMTPARSYALHGRDGVIAQGLGGPSGYYSATRVHTELRWPADGGTRTLTGGGWIDHQWGDFAATPSALRWDWLACCLDDGADLMVYRFLDMDNEPLSGRLVATHVDGSGAVRHLDDRHVRVAELGVLPRPDLGAAFPMRWRVEVPSEGLDLEIEAVSERQFIDLGPPGTVFEGVADITRGGSGRCYVESSRLIGAA